MVLRGGRWQFSGDSISPPATPPAPATLSDLQKMRQEVKERQYQEMMDKYLAGQPLWEPVRVSATIDTQEYLNKIRSATSDPPRLIEEILDLHHDLFIKETVSVTGIVDTVAVILRVSPQWDTMYGELLRCAEEMYSFNEIINPALSRRIIIHRALQPRIPASHKFTHLNMITDLTRVDRYLVDLARLEACTAAGEFQFALFILQQIVDSVEFSEMKGFISRTAIAQLLFPNFTEKLLRGHLYDSAQKLFLASAKSAAINVNVQYQKSLTQLMMIVGTREFSGEVDSQRKSAIARHLSYVCNKGKFLGISNVDAGTALRWSVIANRAGHKRTLDDTFT
jgi:hypothetical protein